MDTDIFVCRNRQVWKTKAMRQLSSGDESGSNSAFARAVSVTNEMVMKLIGVLRRMDITFYVAPYEADAQLAYMSRHKVIDAVISEDSDCIPYGCKTVSETTKWTYIRSPLSLICRLTRSLSLSRFCSSGVLMDGRASSSDAVWERMKSCHLLDGRKRWCIQYFPQDTTDRLQVLTCYVCF